MDMAMEKDFALVYDINHPDIFQTGEYSADAPELEQTEVEQVPERQAAKTSVRSKQGIAPFSILGILVAAFLFVTGIAAQIQLHSLSSEGLALEQQMQELQVQQRKLRIAYESAFNLAEIEEYATEELGMRKPSADQIAYIDTAAPDKAVVVMDGQLSLLDRIGDFFEDLGAYFRVGGA